MNRFSISDFRDQDTTTIASGETDSAAIDCGGMVLKGILIPSGFSGSNITFKKSASFDGDYELVNNYQGSPLSYAVTKGEWNELPVSDLSDIRFIKIVSDAAEGGEVADRVIDLTFGGK